MISLYLADFFQFLVLIPAAFLCFLPMKNQLRYPVGKTVGICSIGVLALILVAVVLTTAFRFDVNAVYFSVMAVCFVCYHRLLKCRPGEELAVFFMVIALLSFMADFAVAVDINVHPNGSIQDICMISTFIQFALSCIVTLAFTPVVARFGSELVDHVGNTSIWYATLPAPVIFLCINFMIQPEEYRNMAVDRLYFLYIFILVILFLLMMIFYVMYYFVAMELIRSAEKTRRVRMLEMQEHQYAAQQTYLDESARQRHDFRQSVITMAELAEENDMEALKAYLQKFVTTLPKNEVTSWCHNPSVNALLNYYETLMTKNNVKLRWEVSLQECKVSDHDFCGMLGNLLENAYRACLTADERDRFHTLSILLKHNRDLYIVSTNSFDGKVRKLDGKYASSRRNSGLGIGLSSIEITAEKYNGFARFSHKGKVFYSDIVMEV